MLLKRGLSATLEEFLMSAEYILAEGNYQVILCERGVRTFSDFSRNTLDLAVVPAVKKLSHLPILVDPSHGTGRRDKVRPVSRGAAAVGADGLIVEVHHDPDTALSDGPQSITPDMFAALMGELRQIAPVLGRSSVRPRAARGALALSAPAGAERGVQGGCGATPALAHSSWISFRSSRRAKISSASSSAIGQSFRIDCTSHWPLTRESTKPSWGSRFCLVRVAKSTVREGTLSRGTAWTRRSRWRGLHRGDAGPSWRAG